MFWEFEDGLTNTITGATESIRSLTLGKGRHAALRSLAAASTRDPPIRAAGGPSEFFSSGMQIRMIGLQGSVHNGLAGG